MKKKYTMEEFKEMFNKAQMKVIESPLDEGQREYLRKQHPEDSAEKMARFQTNQTLAAMMYTNKLYKELFGKED